MEYITMLQKYNNNLYNLFNYVFSYFPLFKFVLYNFLTQYYYMHNGNHTILKTINRKKK